jgi:hypothetical protein
MGLNVHVMGKCICNSGYVINGTHVQCVNMYI